MKSKKDIDIPSITFTKHGYIQFRKSLIEQVCEHQYHRQLIDALFVSIVYSKKSEALVLMFSNNLDSAAFSRVNLLKKRQVSFKASTIGIPDCFIEINRVYYTNCHETDTDTF